MTGIVKGILFITHLTSSSEQFFFSGIYCAYEVEVHELAEEKNRETVGGG